MNKKWWSLLLAAVLLFTLGGCGGSTEPGGGGSGEELALADETGAPLFTIVRGDGADGEEMTVCSAFFNEMKEVFPDIKFVNDANVEDTGDYEILIGHTNREASRKQTEQLADAASGDFIVAVDGKKIVLAADKAAGLTAAKDYFMEQFVTNGKKSIPGDFHYAYQQKITKLSIAGTPAAEFQIVLPRAASYIYTVEVDALQETIRALTGVELTVTDDRAEQKAHEILIGQTNRALSKKLAATDAYEISVQDGCLVLNAGRSDALSSAVIWLNDYLKGQTSDEISIAADFRQNGTYSYTDGRYRLVWNDEFTGNALDTSKWTYRTETAANGQRYTDSTRNTYVSGGTLKQVVQRDFDDEGNPLYTCSQLDTSKAMSFVYGYAEIRVKLPVGRGVWPAFWGNYSKLSTNAFQEIDIFEQFSGNDRRIAFNLHKWWYDTDPFTGEKTQRNENLDNRGLKKYVELENGERMGDAWHTVGVVWTPEKSVALFDGRPYFEYDISGEDDVFWHTPIYLIVNHIIVPRNVGEEGETPFPNVMETDWIRLYQLPGQGELTLLS